MNVKKQKDMKLMTARIFINIRFMISSIVSYRINSSHLVEIAVFPEFKVVLLIYVEAIML